jgi:3-hydroxyacyl-CoA dehydrogenase
MNNDLNIRTVGIMGCGLIGISWAAYYLAKGFALRATDPVAGTEEKARTYIDGVWKVLEQVGLEPGDDKENMTFSTNLAESVSGVDFVQENGPVLLRNGLACRTSTWRAGR